VADVGYGDPANSCSDRSGVLFAVLAARPALTRRRPACRRSPDFAARGEHPPKPRSSNLEGIVMFKHRVLLTVVVVVASYVPAASAFALSGANHNETLLLDV
jgi:hypothetical protein